MSKPLVVFIPHSLGRQEAARRVQSGFSQLQSQFGNHIASMENRWAGDRMDFNVGTMGQNVAGHLEVMDDSVRVEVLLPWILAMIAGKAKGMIQKHGTLMLENK